MSDREKDCNYSGYSCKPQERNFLAEWRDTLGKESAPGVAFVSCSQGWGRLGKGRSILHKPLCLAGKIYDWGLGTHADSEIVLRSNRPLANFKALVGVDDNQDSRKGDAELVFSLWVGEKCLVESRPLSVNSSPECLEANLNGVSEFTLKVKAGNTIHLAHADWVECESVTQDGETFRIGDPEGIDIASTLPVSFVFGGKSSEDCFRQWGVSHRQSSADNFICHEYVSRDPETGFECRMDLQEYTGIPACLWRVYFKNTGKATTPILENVHTLDLNFPASEHKRLHYARGSFHYEREPFSGESFRDDFQLLCDKLVDGQPIRLGGTGGRPSVDWMPYFNYEDVGEESGLVFGIGWTGQWQAQITAAADQIVFQAGMESIHTNLVPGEEISQPSVLMIHWQGDGAIRGHNLLRRFIQEHLLPRHDGKTFQAPACNFTWGGMVASDHLDRVNNIVKEQLPIDYYWIDAGWYGEAGPNEDEFAPDWGLQAGNWNINRETYQHDITEVSDAVHAAGRKFLLWVEPERAVQGTSITIEHPDWFFGGQFPVNTSILLNLGKPEARRWCTDFVAGLIEEQGLDCYRQDFNISPQPFWQAADTPERVGITEIRYVEGLYAFLGELRESFPHLLIDNCASGGRRLDFEMMRYSLPLWASDMQCFPDYLSERNLQLVQGLAYWLPQFSYGTQDHPNDTYHFRATIAAGVNIQLFTYKRTPVQADYPYGWLRERLEEYHRVKQYFIGDFYPLCEQTDSFKYWTANQFNRPDLKSGVLMVFRKSESDIEKMRFRLLGLEAEKAYEFEDVDSQDKIIVSGKELLQNGLPVEISGRRISRLYFYQQKKRCGI